MNTAMTTVLTFCFGVLIGGGLIVVGTRLWFALVAKEDSVLTVFCRGLDQKARAQAIIALLQTQAIRPAEHYRFPPQRSTTPAPTRPASRNGAGRP